MCRTRSCRRVVFLLLRYTDVRRRAAEAQVEELLTNAIPALDRESASSAASGASRRRIRRRPSLFADIVGFTPWAQRTPPDEVVDLLDGCSRRSMSRPRPGLEKIKTIGDAYMAVAGAPAARERPCGSQRSSWPARMVDAVAGWRDRSGVDLADACRDGQRAAGRRRDRPQRLLFDLWGDTVNLAARMESSGVPGGSR